MGRLLLPPHRESSGADSSLAPSAPAHITAPAQLRFEYRSGTSAVLGVSSSRPRLSWVTPSAHPGYVQSEYEVEISGTDRREIHRVPGDGQVLVPWPGKPLASGERVGVRIRTSDSERWSDWSDTATAEAGLLRAEDWSARFISPKNLGAVGRPAPIVSGSIDIHAPVVRARLHVTALGIYVATINGERIGDAHLTPGWTAYEHRLRYQTFDVTEHIRPGSNHLDLLLGNGWYRGRLGFEGRRALYGDRLAALAQLEITTSDGKVHTLASNEQWSSRESAVLADDLYDGQRTDLRRSTMGPAATDSVEVLEYDLHALVAPEGPSVRVTDVLPATRVWKSPSGQTLVDFGQNVVGWTRIKVRGLHSGDEIVIRHAEVLEHGELGTRPLRSALATDSYLVAGGAEQCLEPSLTFHGFRYAEVRGVADLTTDDIQAVVVGSDLERIGWFDSSDPQLNQLHENITWGMRGNYLDIPTDCPQRDERLGWTGDVQVFAPTALFLFNTAGFFASWLADLAAEQAPDGSVPLVIPDVLDTASSVVAAWGDAAVIVPWVIYQRTGDVGILRRQFASMRSWIDRVAARATPARLWLGGFQLGDWLDPTAPPDDPYRTESDPDVVATAHFARSTFIFAEISRILGETNTAKQYSALADEIRTAFAHAYITPAGRVSSDSQTVYALAIQWDLLPQREQREFAGKRLADLVRARDFRIGTGFVGTPLIADALTATGHAHVAHRLLFQTACPSWLYPVTMGATTVWERWDSMLPDGSINPGEMTSFNHVALGSIADWIHRSIAGLAPLSPGYRELLIEPRPPANLSAASARHITPYGEARVEWRRVSGRFRLSVTVPVGATAKVRLPGQDGLCHVGHGVHSWDLDDAQTRTGVETVETIRDVMDDPHLWSAVTRAVVSDEATSLTETEIASRLLRRLDEPAGAIASAILPPESFPAPHGLERRMPSILGARATAAEPSQRTHRKAIDAHRA